MTKKTTQVLIEERVSLSQSRLWQLQKKAYCDYGIRSWTQQQVPFQVTSNPLIARYYAQIAFQVLLRLSTEETLYFLELGSGNGKFAYLFIQELLKQCSQVPERKFSFCYILSDLAESNITYYQNHPFLTDFFDKKLLDVACYDPLTTTAPFLLRAQKQLETTQPLFVIANYFFDSIEQDLLRIDRGIVYEGKITTHSATSSDSTELLKHLNTRVDFEKTTRFDPLLINYMDRSNTTFGFPTGGMKVIDTLSRLSPQGFFLLTGDKGVCDSRSYDPSIAFHSTFSILVNFYLLGKYMEQKGGRSLFQENQEEHFKISLFALGQEFDQGIEHAFNEISKGYSPQEMIDALPSLGSFQLSNHDPYLFFTLQEEIKGQATHEEYRAIVNAVLEHLFPLSQEEGALLYQLGIELESVNDPNSARAYAKASLCEQLPTIELLISVDAQAISRYLEQINPQGKVLVISQEEALLRSILDSFPDITLVSPATTLHDHYDTILFFDFNPPQNREEVPLVVKEGQKKIEMIEQQYPFLKTLQYQDGDIDHFFSILSDVNIVDPKYFVTFFHELHDRGQITQVQLKEVFNRAINGKFIFKDTIETAPKKREEEKEDLFYSIVNRCIASHMKHDATFHAYIIDPTLKSENTAFFNTVVIDPFIHYQESIDPDHQVQKILVQKLSV